MLHTTRVGFGADVGATKTQFLVAVFDRHTVKVKEHWSMPTPKTKQDLAKRFRQALAKARTDHEQKFRQIGIGLPGPLSPDRNKILTPPNAPQLTGLTASSLGKVLGATIYFENDANLFALAEANFGAGKGKERVIGITVGSGMGGGLVIRGKIDRGSHGSAGEIGHMVVAANGFPCACGGRGHLETYVSSHGFMRVTNKHPKEIETDARAGKPYAVRMYNEMGEWLGAGIASAVNLWDPDVVVIGGGIGQAGEILLAPARRRARQDIISPATKKRLKITRARFGRLGGAIGAALLSVTSSE